MHKRNQLGLLLLVALCVIQSQAQEVLHIGSGSIFYVDSNTLVSSLGDVNNNAGAGGTVFVGKNSELKFYGVNWKNASNSPTTGSGKVTLIQPQPGTYTGNATQVLDGGNASSYFNNLTISNPNNVNLANSFTAVHDSVMFTNGLFILNKQNFIVGNGNPGYIGGYTQNAHFVTNGLAQPDSGYLVRDNVGSTATVFPVGYAAGDYTPMSIANTGTADIYKVRVFPNVYENGNAGTLHNDESVQRTWDVREVNIGGGNLNMVMQHNTSSEGGIYAANRNKHYITHYEGYKGTNGGDTFSGTAWDLFTYGSLGAGTSPATLTTGGSIASAVMSSRNNYTDTPGYFTKTVYRMEPLPISLINLKADWKNNIAQVSWTTLIESNNKAFEIEFSTNATDFKYAGTVQSAAISGNSDQPLNYVFNHQEIKQGAANTNYYYRLKQINLDGSFVYTPMVQLNDNVSIQVTAFPNITEGNVKLLVTGKSKAPVQAMLIDNTGRIIQKISWQTDQTQLSKQLDLSALSEGNYQLIVTQGNQSKVLKLVKI